nr:hypothetical protein [Tanacetum cinerariifolium]
GSRIPRILGPAIGRKFGGQRAHALVAEGFGQDRGCCDAAVEAVAANNAGVRQAGVGPKAVAIDQQVRGGHSQRGHGPVHSQIAGLRNVNLEYLGG